MTIEEQIAEKVIELMQGITQANGFTWDVNQVLDWPDTPFAEGDEDTIAVRDIESTISEDDEGQRAVRYEVMLFVSGDDAPNQLRDKTGDIVRAFSDIEQESFVSGGSFEDRDYFVERDIARVGLSIMVFRVDYYAGEWTI